MSRRACYASIAVGAVLYALALSGCAFCSQAVNRNTTECKAYRALQQCGPKALVLVASCVTDLGDYVALLETIATDAPEEYACVSAAIKNETLKKWGESSPKYISLIETDTRLSKQIKAKKL